jgi:hypothetical protein
MAQERPGRVQMADVELVPVDFVDVGDPHG